MTADHTLEHDLASFLKAKGFTHIEMTKNVVGHFEIDATLNDHEVRFLVDTGASRTVIDRATAVRLNLPLGSSSQRAGGVGTADHSVDLATGVALASGGLQLRCDERVAVIDLSHVSQSLVSHGGQRIDGAIGGDVLSNMHAIIDYRAARLYLHVEDPVTS